MTTKAEALAEIPTLSEPAGRLLFTWEQDKRVPAGKWRRLPDNDPDFPGAEIQVSFRPSTFTVYGGRMVEIPAVDVRIEGVMDARIQRGSGVADSEGGGDFDFFTNEGEGILCGMEPGQKFQLIGLLNWLALFGESAPAA